MTINLVALFRCEEKPTDLPKKATLPSVQTDTMSYTEEYNTAVRYFHHHHHPSPFTMTPLIFDTIIRGSITSFHKVSRNSSFRRDTIANCGPDGDEDGGGGGVGANKESQSVLKNLMKNIKQKSEEEQGFSFLEV